MAQKKRSPNASGSIFGWHFQTAAGIYLFLKNIEHAEAIKMEGEIEDIEIRLDDSTKIYAQAKASSLAEPKNEIKQLKDALDSLYACPKDSKYLVYVTNHLNPLRSKSQEVYAALFTSFDNFLEDDKAKVQSYLNELGKNDFETSKFKILSIRFSGDDDEERYGNIKKAVDEFLDKAGIVGKGQKALKEWRLVFGENNSKKHIELSKKDVVFPLILIILENQVDEDRYSKICEQDLYSEVMEKYDSLVRKLPSQYEFFSRVRSEFMNANKLAQLSKEEYVKRHWTDYDADFKKLIPEEKERESFIKIVLMATIMKREVIKKIKDAAGLD